MEKISIVTGITLGLRRGGKDMKRDAMRRRKESKIKPGEKMTPSGEIEDVSGGTFIAVERPSISYYWCRGS